MHQACRWLERGNPAPGGVAQRESRRGPMAPMLRVLHVLAGSDLREPAHQPVRVLNGIWTLLRWASATMAGLLLHVGKQQSAAMTGQQKSLGI